MTISYPPIVHPLADMRTLVLDQLVRHVLQGNSHITMVLQFISDEGGLQITAADLEAALPGPWSLAQVYKACKRADDHRKRAKRHGLKDHFGSVDWLRVLSRAGDRCEICSGADRPLTVEHMIPLSEGGTNTAANLAATCEACNAARDHIGDDYLKLITGWPGFN